MTSARIESLRQLLAGDPRDATAHYMLGHEYIKAQCYAEAIESLRAYLALAEDEGAAYRLLAQALRQLGRIPEARQAYQDGLAAATRNAHQPLIEEYSQALADLE